MTFSDQTITSENDTTAELESPFLTGENQVCTGLNKISPENTQTMYTESQKTEHTLKSVIELLNDIMFEVKFQLDRYCQKRSQPKSLSGNFVTALTKIYQELFNPKF